MPTVTLTYDEIDAVTAILGAVLSCAPAIAAALDHQPVAIAAATSGQHALLAARRPPAPPARKPRRPKAG